MVVPSFSFPTTRLRRNRSALWKRRLLGESVLTTDHLIWPLFLREESVPRDIPSMPGVYRFSLDEILRVAQEALDLGIPAIMLFPALEQSKKSALAEEAYNPDNLVNSAIRLIKSQCPSLGVMADVALDPYTGHGQDGIVKEGVILNDETLEILSKQGISLAEAGVDWVGPSDMMDGRIGRLRKDLDQAGYKECGILAYSAKYASGFYGPFRDAVCSKASLGKMDKKTYQMSPSNGDEALREVFLDIQEGADAVMIKPGLPYLDILSRVKREFSFPTLVYHVSGEYAMLKAAAEKGWLDYETALMETLIAFRRAGADGILTYAAPDAARFLQNRGYFNAV